MIVTQSCGVFKGYPRSSATGGTMQECRVCGLLFLGGGACPTCGSQVATDIDTDDIVMDDENIPGLDEIAEAIGDDISEDSSEVLPFGMGAKAEVMESSLPFGVGSYTSEVNEQPSSITAEFVEQADPETASNNESVATEKHESKAVENAPDNDGVSYEVEIESEDLVDDVADTISEVETNFENQIGEEHHTTVDEPIEVPTSTDHSDSEVKIDLPNQTAVVAESVEEIETPNTIVNDVPDMWRIDAAEVDMEAIYAQEEQVVEVSFDGDTNDDVLVTFDDFHHSPVEESMASDEDAPELHPAKALSVDSAGQPEIASMVESSFEAMANSSWMQAAQILSTASNNRQNDPAILNNLGLALLQSALEMDSLNDPMSESQYEAAIMALRQSAKIDSQNNTILLNLSHALLVSGRAEKALKVINVLRSRLSGDIEVENVFGACLIQLGRDEEAESILRPYSSDAVVRANLDLI